MKHLREIRVVVASPSDVKPERNCLNKVAEELNRGIANNLALNIKIARWETDAFPGFHIEGPQGLIDQVLRIEECDLLIGIFWKRFGSPTADARSGTEHEIRKAYEAWQRYQRPQIMVYFNEKPSYTNNLEEIDQWRQVLQFKHEFPKEGLWWTYIGKPQFEELIRQHLTQFILKISQDGSTLNNSHVASSTLLDDAPSIDEQISQWLELFSTTASKEQYKRHITAFREVLRQNGLDFDSEDDIQIRSLFEAWAYYGRNWQEYSERTYNLRLSIVKSFYRFARKKGFMRKNPLEFLDSRKKVREDIPQSLTLEEIMKVIKAIDRSTLMGKRDIALLAVLLTTGNFISEVAELRGSDIVRTKNSTTLIFHRARDGKMTPEKLSYGVAKLLDEYITAAYPGGFEASSHLWISLDHIRKGGPLDKASIHKISAKYLHTGRGLTTRRIYATMKKGAIGKEIDKIFQ